MQQYLVKNYNDRVIYTYKWLKDYEYQNRIREIYQENLVKAKELKEKAKELKTKAKDIKFTEMKQNSMDLYRNALKQIQT